jgi:hypothetical protein
MISKRVYPASALRMLRGGGFGGVLDCMGIVEKADLAGEEQIFTKRCFWSSSGR